MRNWNYQFKQHQKYFCTNMSKDKETFLSFSQWLNFYNADPKHWVVKTITGDRYYNAPDYYVVRYEKPDKDSQWIKFTSLKDYKKFVKWWEVNGGDYENDQEILELATIITNISKKEIEKQHKKNQETLRAIKDIGNNIRLELFPEQKVEETTLHEITTITQQSRLPFLNPSKDDIIYAENTEVYWRCIGFDETGCPQYARVFRNSKGEFY